MNRSAFLVLTASLALALCAPAARATERGALRALNGAPGVEVSAPQFPGLYAQVWTQHYRASRFRDVNGNAPALSENDTLVGPLTVERRGEVTASVGVLRGTWLSEFRWGEGKFGLSATLPFVQVEQRIELRGRFAAGMPAAVRDVVQERLDLVAGRASLQRRGLGDLELMPYFDWQTDEARYALGLGVVAPTGDYDEARSVNPGAGNFWTLRPLLVGARAWENGLAVGVRATYSINGQNRDTKNRSGQYLAADANLFYSLNDFLRIGVQGFVNWQTTADRCADAAADLCGKVRVFGLGPALAYTTEDGRISVDAKVLREFGVRNRPEGTAFWLRLNLRLDE